MEFVPRTPPRPAGLTPNSAWSPVPRVPPAWTWSTRVAAPTAGRTQIFDTQLVRPDAELRVLDVAQTGASSNQSYDRRPFRCPTVQVEMKVSREPIRLTLARVTDEKGRSAVPQWQSDSTRYGWNPHDPRPSHLFRPDDGPRTFVLPSLPGARTLRLEFVAHRATTVEFLTAPPPR